MYGLTPLTWTKSFALANYAQSQGDRAKKRFYILSTLLLPSISRLVESEASTQVSVQLAITALAIERFRLERGRLPDELKDLVPQYIDTIPTDPFDGALIRYQRLIRGYKIYSVGADGHDDGGREAPKQKKATDKSSYDITFIVER
ncbi:MAG TPA: hypothetical protein VFC44_07720 [Candidatus Saccharimonadales bacterium]|nr:hypothetical protein [Candidatus Saccharimonadales bacterium]